MTKKIGAAETPFGVQRAVLPVRRPVVALKKGGRGGEKRIQPIFSRGQTSS